ncbi:PAS domain-containing methyl-accepting chemotaxis protein [Methylobacterium sp. 1973]|uniref:methyl-accepting chemotaxis protein n=1 Tax=Methylobacterium sp. 1973 TaxID=3156421 RepID=UPI003390C12E
MISFRTNDGAQLVALNRSQAVAEFKPDGTVLSANQNFLDLLGYTLDEIKGRSHALLVEPIFRDTPAYQSFWNGLRRGEFQSGEFRRVTKDGRQVWIQGTYNPILDRTGRVAKVVKFAIDITATKLRSLEADGRLAALDRSQAIIAFGLDGTILEANSNFLAVMGYRLEEVLGRHHSMFMDEAEVASEAYSAFWAALGRGEYQAAEYRRLAKGGVEVFIHGTYNPISDADGRLVKVVKFAVDVTEQVRLRQRRAEAQRAIGNDLDAIGQAVEDVTRQTSGAANAVGRISGDIQLVASGAEELAASVGEISQQVTNAARLTGEAVSQAEHTTSIIEGLTTQASQIGDVVGMIAGIASQTNLLALNATIEAARAGPAGRGFAVVAAEVKTLAEQTARATGQIGKQIAANQSATREAVEAIGAIGNTIRRLDEVSSAISAAVEEQSAVTREMSGSMLTASNGVASIATGMDLIARASERVDGATRQVRDVARALG